MTSAVYRATAPSLSVPQTQNTAPVLEYNCLYTHDIRRKQKRWQDGFLRYHTFNRRVMVYDVPRNFVGDMHWTRDEDLQDGDEVTLEKGGVLVQVADCCGETETDLTELKASSKKGRKAVNRSSSPARAMPAPRLVQTPMTMQRNASGPRVQLKHRSLNALLGKPKGPMGKAALPTRSPFEERQANSENEAWEEGRPPKRPRTAEPPVWNITRSITSPSKKSHKKDAPLWAQMADSRKNKGVAKGQQTLGTREVIDLSTEAEDPSERFLPGFSSDALVPLSSPQKDVSTPKLPAARSSSPALKTTPSALTVPNNQHVPQAKQAPKSTDVVDGAAYRKRNVPTSRTEHIVSSVADEHDPSGNIVHPTNSGVSLRKEQSAGALPSAREGSKKEKLRIAPSAPKKKTLLCHAPSSKPSRVAPTNADDGVFSLRDAVSRDGGERPKTQRQLLEERLTRMKTKEDARAAKRRAVDSPTRERGFAEPTVTATSIAKAGSDSCEGTELPNSALEATRVELGRLDQMLVMPQVPPSPPLVLTDEDTTPATEPRTDITFRRVVSETNSIRPPAPVTSSKRVTGAPVRYTPSPAKVSLHPSSRSIPETEFFGNDHSSTKSGGLRFTSKRDKKQLQRAVSLNTTASGTSTAIFAKPFRTPRSPVEAEPEEPKDLGPWSREASDLFGWRPPGWDEETWCPAVAAAEGERASRGAKP